MKFTKSIGIQVIVYVILVFLRGNISDSSAYVICITILQNRSFLRRIFQHEGHEGHEEKSHRWTPSILGVLRGLGGEIALRPTAL
jgi:hypothetical protein